MSDAANATGAEDSRPVDRTKSSSTRKRDEHSDEERIGFFARIVRFVREVIGEMKKVRYPTREELWTYFLVVIVFVAVLMAFTGLADLGFSKLSDIVFG